MRARRAPWRYWGQRYIAIVPSPPLFGVSGGWRGNRMASGDRGVGRRDCVRIHTRRYGSRWSPGLGGAACGAFCAAALRWRGRVALGVAARAGACDVPACGSLVQVAAVDLERGCLPVGPLRQPRARSWQHARMPRRCGQDPRLPRVEQRKPGWQRAACQFAARLVWGYGAYAPRASWSRSWLMRRRFSWARIACSSSSISARMRLASA